MHLSIPENEDPSDFIKSLKVWGGADQIELELMKMPPTENAVTGKKGDTTRDKMAIWSPLTL